MSLDFSFVQMWVYPALVEAKVAPRMALIAGIFAVAIATFLVYFMFGTHASSYVPYRNVLFMG